MSHIGIGHQLDPMWDGSNAPELKRGGQIPDGPWPEPRGPRKPPETEPLYCPYCDKLRSANKQHACKQTVRMLYIPGTVVAVKKDTWALILDSTQSGLIKYQQFTPTQSTFQEEPIEDFHMTVTGDPVTP